MVVENSSQDTGLLERAPGDGSPSRVTEEEMAVIKSEIAEIVSDQHQGLWTSQVDAENIRFCRWTGQSADGRKHADANDGVPVKPFEGATDQRVRLADMLINEKVRLVVLATMRARVKVKGVEAEDTQYAGNLELVLRWMLRSGLGFEWFRELIKLANYVFGDSPAVGLMAINWRRETALRNEEMTIDGLMNLYLQIVMESFQEENTDLTEEDFEAAAQQAIDDFMDALNNDVWGTDALAGMLQEMFPHLKTGKARKVIRRLRKTGTAEFPVPYIKEDGVLAEALRVNDDWYAPINTTTFQNARYWFRSDWLSEVEVRERGISLGWSDAFIEELLKHDGEAVFKEYVRDITTNQLLTRDDISYKGLYQVVTVYARRANEDGVPGRYFTTVHTGLEEAATEWQLVDYDHGNYGGHAVQREVLTKRLMDSRGISELAGPDQDLLKMFWDAYGDNSQLSGVPPVLSRGRQRKGKLYIRPLAELQVKRDGDIKWMQPPTFSATIDKMMALMRQFVNEYHARPGENVDPQVVQLGQEFLVAWWLANMAEIYRQMLQLAQQFMSDEMVQRITNDQGMRFLRSVEEIQGQFDIDLHFDPRDMDPAFLETIGNIIKNTLVALDRDKTIKTAPIVEALLWRLVPDMAEGSLQTVEDANASQIAGAVEALVQIRAGTEPERMTDGSINYDLYVQFYEQMERVNPSSFADMAADKVAMFQAWLEFLRAQGQQFGENAQIGREGAERAF